MLLGNYQMLAKNPITLLGGDSTSGITGLRSNWNQKGNVISMSYGENWVEGTADRYGNPAGYFGNYAWIQPQKAGGIGSNVGVIGLGRLTSSGALGVNIDATIDGLGEISSASLGLILSAVATLSGLGGLSANVVGALNASATLAGEGDFTGSLGALAGAVAILSGTGEMAGATNAKASLSSDIYVNQSTASVNEIVAGVWNAVASQFNASGTMGQKLNGAGSAGDPWTTDLTPYITTNTAGALLKKATKPKISL